MNHSKRAGTPPLVEAVAFALSIAIKDPTGHPFWKGGSAPATPSGPTLQPAPSPAHGRKPRTQGQTMQAVQVFDSSSIPPISIDKYLARLNSTFRCQEATFVAALVLVDRLLEHEDGHVPLTMLNVHRVYLASLVVATKFHEDQVYSNAHYAKAGGVHLKEVNRLERVLLSALDFDLRVSPEEYRVYEATLRALAAPRKRASGGSSSAG